MTLRAAGTFYPILLDSTVVEVRVVGIGDGYVPVADLDGRLGIENHSRDRSHHEKEDVCERSYFWPRP